MQIVTYPYFTLRYESQTLMRVDAALRKIVAEMFELMYEANGVGLAANQVDLPLRMFVINMAAEPGEGEEMVFINPVISRPKGNEEADEGCLSLPGIYGNVPRSKQIRLQAFNLRGEEFKADLDGLFARVVQHENDHLDGVLFTDRMTTTGKLAIRESLEEFELEKQSLRNLDQLESDEQIQERLTGWEEQYCRQPG
ncbi:MAG: peptide deformylase [Pirellulaceae bacterium]|nr:peptide deformylase [Pirellulaceae bacterium]